MIKDSFLIGGKTWYVAKSTDKHFSELQEYRYFMFPLFSSGRGSLAHQTCEDLATLTDSSHIIIDSNNEHYVVFDDDATYALFCLMDETFS